MKKSMCGILSYICIPNVKSYMGQNLGLLKFFKCFVSKSGAQSKHKQIFTSCLFSHSRSEQRFSEWSRSRNFFTRDRKKNLETEPGKNGSALQPWKFFFFFYVSSSVVRRGQCLQPLLYRYNTLCYCLIPVPVSAKNQTFFSFSLSNFGGVMLSIICPPDGLFQQKPTENQIWVLAAVAFLKKIRQIFVDCHCVRVVLFNTDTLVLI